MSLLLLLGGARVATPATSGGSYNPVRQEAMRLEAQRLDRLRRLAEDDDDAAIAVVILRSRLRF